MVDPGTAMLISAGIGGATNLLGSKNANKPKTTNTTSTYNDNLQQRLYPYGGQAGLDSLNNIMNLGGFGLGYGLLNAPYGPNETMNSALSRYEDLTFQPFSGLGRISVPEFVGPSVNAALKNSLERMTSLKGMPGTSISSLGVKPVNMSPEEIATFTTEPNPYLKQVLSGRFLGENPYLDEVIEGITRDATRAYQEGVVPQIDSSFARAGRYGSNAYATAQGNANRAFNEELGDLIGRVRSSDYQAERGNMMQALGLYENDIMSARNQLATMRNADLAAAAQLRAQAIAAWQQGNIAEAQILASFAQQKAAAANQRAALQAQLDAQIEIAGGQLGLQQRGMAGSELLNLYGLGQNQNQSALQGALLPMGMISDYAGLLLPLLAQFGSQETSRTGYSTGANTAPGAGINPIGSFLSGGLGGAASGLALWNMFNGLSQPGISAADAAKYTQDYA